MSNNLPSIRRIHELIDDITDNRLVIRPRFQRRQVWNNADKEKFIDTILKGYPFPEVFVAEDKRENKLTRRQKVLVDGQQRLSTVMAYVDGSDELLYKSIRKFSDLSDDEQADFMNYIVAVRDIGTATSEVIKEIFNRINSTDYALKTMEILNAMFSGEYKQFCEQLSRDPFFEKHKVFPIGYKKRMLDVNFCVIFVTTLLSGYYKRDERNREYLERYNEEFGQVDAVRAAIDKTFDFIDRCNFPSASRAWKQTDLFTLLVEVHSAVVVKEIELDPDQVGARVQAFYDEVDSLFKQKGTGETSASPLVFAYLKAATKATNDKYSRVERANIISNILVSE